MKTDELIDCLAKEPPPRWSFQSGVGLAIAGGTFFTAFAFFTAIGLRPDISEAIGSVRFLFKLAVTLALANTACGAAQRIGDPSRAMKTWGWALGAIPALLVCAVAIELVVVPDDAWLHRLVGHDARRCLTLIPLLSIGPLGALLIALREGAPLRPGLAGAIAGLAAGGIAATFYASNCVDDSPLFVATWFTLAILTVTAAGYVAGQRLLKW